MANWTNEPNPFGANRVPLLAGLSKNDGITPVPVAVDPTNGAIQTAGGSAASSVAINDGLTTARKATVANLTNANPLAVEIVDGSGNQITSFGGGTQYTDGNAAPTHPIGNANLYKDNSNNWVVSGISNPFPVLASQTGTWNINNVSGTVSLPTGASTSTKQPALGTAGTASSDVITVQGIASMTALKVDGSGVTQPVSGTFWQATQPVSIADGSDTTLGAKADAKSTATDTTAISVMQVLKEISFMEQNPASRAVTNAGTFAVQATLQAASSTIVGQVEVTDGTNVASTLKSDGTAAGQNALLVGGTGYTTGTISLSAGTQNTSWYDMLNYSWVSVEILTNTTPATLTFQTSGDASQTNVVSTSMFPATSTNSTGTVTSTTSASQTYHGPRTGRYFRISSNLAGGNTATLVLTFFTNASAMNSYGGITVSSNSATGSAVPANAYYQAGDAATALPSAASPGNLTGIMVDKFGRPIILNNAMRDIMGTQTTTISASTSETTIITQAASIFNDLVSVFISNTSATAVRVDIRDTTGGSVIFQLYIPAGDMRGLSLSTPWPQTTVNTNWTAQSSASVTDLRVSALFIKNK